MRTTIAISCLLMGASFAPVAPTIAYAANEADSQAETDKAVAIAQVSEGVTTVKDDLKVREDA